MEFVMQFTGLEEQIQRADIIITGEGKIDRQTLSGKVINGVAQLARKYNKRLFVVAGTCELTSAELKQLGVYKVITLMREGISEDYAIRNASLLLKQRIKEGLVQILTL
jgi:glycerate kinase